MLQTDQLKEQAAAHEAREAVLGAKRQLPKTDANPGRFDDSHHPRAHAGLMVLLLHEHLDTINLEKVMWML